MLSSTWIPGEVELLGGNLSIAVPTFVPRMSNVSCLVSLCPLLKNSEQFFATNIALFATIKLVLVIFVIGHCQLSNIEIFIITFQ